MAKKKLHQAVIKAVARDTTTSFLAKDIDHNADQKEMVSHLLGKITLCTASIFLYKPLVIFLSR